MWQCQINILCVIWQDCADLQVRASFYGWWWFECKHSLKTVDAVFDVWRVWRSEMFGESKQCCIPCVWLMLCNSRRHCHVLKVSYNAAHKHTVQQALPLRNNHRITPSSYSSNSCIRWKENRDRNLIYKNAAKSCILQNDQCYAPENWRWFCKFSCAPNNPTTLNGLTLTYLTLA